MNRERLVKEATKTARSRGHRLQWADWIDRPTDRSVRQAHCPKCGRGVTVIPKPRPNEIDICGEAVALGCPELTRAMADEVENEVVELWWDYDQKLQPQQVQYLLDGGTETEFWFDELQDLTQDWVWELERDAIRRVLSRHIDDVTDTVVSHFVDEFGAWPVVDPNMGQLVRQSHTPVSLNLSLEYTPPADAWDGLEAMDQVLELLGVDPAELGRLLDLEDLEAPAEPDREPAVDVEELAQAVVNMSYLGQWVVLLTYHDVARAAKDAGQIRKHGVRLRKGTTIAVHSYWVGATSSLVTLTRDLEVPPGLVEGLYADKTLTYGVQRTCGLTDRAWSGDWEPLDAPAVRLHEDNAGGLYLSCGDQVWADLEHTESNFADDAAAVLAGEVDGWTVPRADGADLEAPIAIYTDGKVERTGLPVGRAGQMYLGD